MNNPVIMIQTKTIYVVGELLSFYTSRLDTQLIKVDEPTEIIKYISNYNQDEGDWYAWSVPDSCCSFQYVMAIKALSKVKNLIGSTFETLIVDGTTLHRRLGIVSLGTLDVFDNYKLTETDRLYQEIVFSKISELLNLRSEVDFLKGELESKSKGGTSRIFNDLFLLGRKAS